MLSNICFRFTASKTLRNAWSSNVFFMQTAHSVQFDIMILICRIGEFKRSDINLVSTCLSWLWFSCVTIHACSFWYHPDSMGGCATWHEPGPDKALFFSSCSCRALLMRTLPLPGCQWGALWGHRFNAFVITLQLDRRPRPQTIPATVFVAAAFELEEICKKQGLMVGRLSGETIHCMVGIILLIPTSWQKDSCHHGLYSPRNVLPAGTHSTCMITTAVDCW